MSKGTAKLSERINTAEFENQIQLKSYDKLVDRVSPQEGNLHTIQIISKYYYHCSMFKILLIREKININMELRGWIQHIVYS